MHINKNLINIYSSFCDSPVEFVVEKYKGKMYSEFKTDLADVIIEDLKPIQNRYNDLIADKGELDKIFSMGRDKASYQSNKTLSKVYRKAGLIKPT